VISIITVGFHSEKAMEGLKRCIQDVREPVQLLFHDNTEHNIGLSKAINILIRKAEGDVIILANPDTIFDRNISKMTDFTRFYPMSGAVPIFRGTDVSRRLPNLIRLLMMATTLGKTVGRPIKKDYDHPKGDIIEQPGGSFLVLSREAVDLLMADGYFYDEQFPVFWNDVDLAMRARDDGINFIKLPIIVRHQGEHSMATVNQERRMMLFYSRAGLIGFANKWGFHPRIIKIAFFIDAIVAVIIRMIGRLRHGGDFKSSILKFRASLQ